MIKDVRADRFAFFVRLSSLPSHARDLEIVDPVVPPHAQSIEITFIGPDCFSLRSFLSINDHFVFVALKRSKLKMGANADTHRYVLALDESALTHFQIYRVSAPQPPTNSNPDLIDDEMILPEAMNRGEERPSKRHRVEAHDSLEPSSFSSYHSQEDTAQDAPLIGHYIGVITKICHPGLWELDDGQCFLMTSHIIFPPQERLGFRIGAKIRISHSHLVLTHEGSRITICACPATRVELVALSSSIFEHCDFGRLSLPVALVYESLARFDFRTSLWFYDVPPPSSYFPLFRL